MRAVCPVFFAAALLLSNLGCSPRLWLMKPKVKKVRPRFKRIGWSGVDVEFRVEVRNPNYLRLRTPRFRCGLDVEGIEFLKADVPVRYDLPARTTATLTLPTRISYIKLWRTYRKLRHASEGHYRLHGTLLYSVLGRDLGVSLAKSGTFPVLRMPRVRAASIGFSRVSFTRLKATVEADVTNPNIFGVEIDDLGYALQIGDTRIGGLTASTSGTIGPGETGRVTLAGQVSATRAAFRLLRGIRDIKKTKLVPTGFLKTPYGTVNLDDYAKTIGREPDEAQEQRE